MYNQVFMTQIKFGMINISDLKGIIRAVVKELGNSSSINSSHSRSERNSWSRKIDKHEICYYGHHLSRSAEKTQNINDRTV